MASVRFPRPTCSVRSHPTTVAVLLLAHSAAAMSFPRGGPANHNGRPAPKVTASKTGINTNNIANGATNTFAHDVPKVSPYFWSTAPAGRSAALAQPANIENTVMPKQTWTDKVSSKQARAYETGINTNNIANGAMNAFAHDVPKVSPYIPPAADQVPEPSEPLAEMAVPPEPAPKERVSEGDELARPAQSVEPAVLAELAEPVEPAAPTGVQAGPPMETATVQPVRDATVEQRARELAQAALEDYFSDRIDEQELQRRKHAARNQALAERAAIEEAARELLEEARRVHASAMSERKAVEKALQVAVKAEAVAAQKMEEALRAIER